LVAFSFIRLETNRIDFTDFTYLTSNWLYNLGGEDLISLYNLLLIYLEPTSRLFASAILSFLSISPFAGWPLITLVNGSFATYENTLTIKRTTGKYSNQAVKRG
jgi:hypothetical protein